MAKLDSALAAAQRASTLGRCGPAERWAFKNQTLASFLTFAAPVATIGSTACIWPEAFFPIFLLTMFAGVVTFYSGTGLYDHIQAKKDATNEPALNSSELGPALTLLRELPAEERAWLIAYATREIDARLARGKLTVAAADGMREALSTGTEKLAREVRAGKAAMLVYDAGTRPWQPNSWASLLSSYDGSEKGEIARLLEAAFFKDERCTLPVTVKEGNALYVALKQAQAAA